MIYSLFQWVESTAFALYIKDSRFGFGITEVIHLLGLVLLLGGLLGMSLRLMGVFMADRPVSEVAAELRRWILIGLGTMVASGLALWASEAASRFYDKGWFWFKMAFLATAIVFHFTVYRRVTRKDSASPALRLLTAVFTLLLWFGVGFAGRAIGFLHWSISGN